MRPGAVLVVHTTGSRVRPRASPPKPGTWRRGDRCAGRGGPHDVAAGQVTLFVGGSDDAVSGPSGADQLRRSHPPCGPDRSGPGRQTGQRHLFAAQIGLLREAVRFGDRLGVDERQLLDAIGHGSAASRVASIVGAQGSVNAFIDMVGEFVGKDVAVVRKTVAEVGGDLGILDDVINVGFEKSVHFNVSRCGNCKRYS